MGLHAMRKADVESFLYLNVLMLDYFSIVCVVMAMKILIRCFLNPLINFLLQAEAVLHNLIALLKNSMNITLN